MLHAAGPFVENSAPPVGQHRQQTTLAVSRRPDRRPGPTLHATPDRLWKHPRTPSTSTQTRDDNRPCRAVSVPIHDLARRKNNAITASSIII
jgi:hypothetical protein